MSSSLILLSDLDGEGPITARSQAHLQPCFWISKVESKGEDHLGYYLEETEGKMFDLYFIRSKSVSKLALKIHSESRQLPQIILLHLTSWLIIRMHHFFFVMMTNSMSAIWKEGHLLFRANCKVHTCFRFFVLLCVGKEHIETICVGKEHIETIWGPLVNDKCCGTRKKLHKVSAQLLAGCALCRKIINTSSPDDCNVSRYFCRVAVFVL